MNGEIISMMAQGALPAARLDEPVLGAAPAADVARFADAMGSRTAPEPMLSGVAGVEPGSFFDSIRLVGQNYTQMSAEMKSVLGKGAAHVDSFDLIKLQLQMIDTSLLVDLVSRTVQKATQHVDQLTKLQ
ncbi:Type III secretion needle MxiH like protein [Variovorax sp. PBL-H6]|uniref:EscI/YscI/HrpB family type III secretion system inner rod protein n=1 Tax=Variovorax sp. PBL-H6 TaxID=434009 RepID=UPI0013172711|nr:EscI/YscI/HrpB family type III secretion system inner rod protein [Variovorax sp. PBL-H6]VTU22727.1 Type III secretion needle MxiH like protein [Variovorax sp. PBL-H6]